MDKLLKIKIPCFKLYAQTFVAIEAFPTSPSLGHAEKKWCGVRSNGRYMYCTSTTIIILYYNISTNIYMS